MFYFPAFDIPDEFINPEDEKDGGKRGENAFTFDILLMRERTLDIQS